MSDNWHRIKQALEHPDFNWRTIEGIRHDTGFEPAAILAVLDDYADEIVKSDTPSTTGQDLYTTRDHYRIKSSLWEREQISTRR